MRGDYVRTALGLARQTRPADIALTWAELEARARAWLAEEGIRPDRQLLERTADMRYLGQNYELPVSAPAGAWDEAAQIELERRFHAVHERTYGYAAVEEPIQFVNFRVTAYGLTPHIRLRRHEPGHGSASDAIVGERRVYWTRGSAAEPTPIYHRARLEPGHEIVGPAIVEQMDSTTLIGPGHHARLDEYRNLHVDLEPS